MSDGNVSPGGAGAYGAVDATMGSKPVTASNGGSGGGGGVGRIRINGEPVPNAATITPNYSMGPLP
jgi:hypothetical protein